MSSDSRWGRRSAIVSSTAAAGTISQTARGFSSFETKSWSEELPVAFSCANSFTAFEDLSKTTHRWPPLRARRTMFAPILPRPIIPNCMDRSFAKSLFDCLMFFRNLARTGSQPLHRCGDSFALSENRRSGDQNIRPCRNHQTSSVRVDAAVDFHVASGIDFLDHLADASDLSQGCGYEVLMPKTGINRHDQHLFDVLYDFLQNRRGRCRVDGHSRTLAQRFDPLHCAVEIGITLPVN